MSHSVAEAIYGVSPTARGVGRVTDLVFGAATAVAPAPTGGQALAPVVKGEPLSRKLVKFAPHAVGLVVGYGVWKKHRVLGALAGHALINSGYEYYKGDKKKALCELAVEGAGILGALKLWKGRKPAAGWIVGVLVGAAATYFVDDSPARRLVQRLK